jgi:hypothetical protein
MLPLPPPIFFINNSLAPCFFPKGDYYMFAVKVSPSTCEKGDGEAAASRPQMRAGSPSGLDFTATCFGSEQKPADDPGFQRDGWALIAGSGDRCLLRCRSSE